MTSNWIKMRTNLGSDPRVLSIAARLRVKDTDTVVGKLHKLWSYADEYTTDGVIHHMTPELLDAKLGIIGISAALQAVGWLEFSDDSARIPRFDEHNSESAKRRSVDAKRKAESRTSVRNLSDESRTENGQQPELDKRKNRIEKETTEREYLAPAAESINPLVPETPNLIPDDLVQAWNDFATPRRLRTVCIPSPRKRFERLLELCRGHPDRQWWADLFAEIERSKFLLGAESDWSITLDWLIDENNLAKVIEGNYRKGSRGKANEPRESAEKPDRYAADRERAAKQAERRAAATGTDPEAATG